MLSMRRRNLLILGAIGLVIAAYFAARSWRGQSVDVWLVDRQPLVQSVVLTGRVANESRVWLGATITGRVQTVSVREGDSVKPGAVLMNLEESELQASLAQAQAALSTAEARLQSQQSLLGPVAQQQLLQARANAHNAANDFVRQQSLFAKGFIGQARLDEAERAKQVADSQVTAAESQATANINGSEMKQTIARVAEARAAVAFATSRLQQARIVAPSEGMVLERLAEPGQIVQPGTKLLSLSLSGPTQLVAQVDEKFLAQLKVGQSASVVADAYPGQKFAATIQRIAPTIDTQRGSVEVKFAVATAPTFLRNDMTLSIEVETARRDKVIVLPAEYVSGGSTPQVMVIENNRASIRPVKLGVRSTTLVEVLDGLREGETVIADAKIPVGARVSVGDEVRAKKLLPANINAAATEGMKAFADR